MKTSRRIAVFFIGVLIGCVLIYFTLIKGRDRTYWLPSNRVRNELLSRKLFFPENTLCKMKCAGLDKNQVKEILNTGKIDFGKSHIHGVPIPSYAIDGSKITSNQIVVFFTTIDSTTEVTAVDYSTAKPDTCNCK